MFVTTKLEAGLASENLNNIDAYVKGKVFPLPVETANSFEAYTNELKGQFTAANEALTDTTLQDAKLRAELVYTTAIYRDSLYYLAGRKRLLGLSVNNSYRETYQIAKVSKDTARAINLSIV